MDWAMIVAAGRGERMGFEQNKVFVPFAGACALARCVDAFLPHVHGLVVVIGQADVQAWEALHREKRWPGCVQSVLGGSTRQESVAKGLEKLPQDVDIVLVHDAARPMVSPDLIRRCLDSAKEHGSGVAAIPVIDTIVLLDAQEGYEAALPRERLRAMQTPQAFRREWLEQAHEQARAEGFAGTDDASLLHRAGYPVRLIPGEADNWKLTTPSDFANAQRVAQGAVQPSHGPARTGFGYDVHRLVEGRSLILCGVEIPYERGLDGHSDADVAIHALMDALLGAAGLGDIGRHFPDTDPRYKGISSMKLLETVVERLGSAGWQLIHCDVTLIAQRPKLAPFMDAMVSNLSKALRLSREDVNIKATTTEGLGFEGRGEGISAMAAATLAGRP